MVATDVFDWRDLGIALKIDFEGEGLNSTTCALEETVLVQHFLKLGIWFANITKVIIPLINDSI